MSLDSSPSEWASPNSKWQGTNDHLQHVQRIDEGVLLGIQVIGGHILLPILVLTVILSKRVTRHPVFVNFCISWIISSIVYSMLLYRGGSGANLPFNPSYGVCLVQAALLDGVQALTVCTNLSLAVHLWNILRTFTKSKSDPAFLEKGKTGIAYTRFLIAIPLIVFVGFTAFSAAFGSTLGVGINTRHPMRNSNHPIPGVFDCIVILNADFSDSIAPGLGLLWVVYGFRMITSLITICFEGFAAILVYKQRSKLRESSNGWLSLFLRIGLFSAYRVLVFCMKLAFSLHPDESLLAGISRYKFFNGTVEYMQAAFPLVAFLVFATEKDILGVWCFWRKGLTEGKQSRNEHSTKEGGINLATV